MKKFTALAVMAVTLYFAGIYRQKPMLIMLLMEIILVAVMMILPHILKKKVSVAFSKKNRSAKKDTELICQIDVSNNNKIPVNKFETQISFQYDDKKSKIKKTLYGCADTGNNNVIEFGFVASYCGNVSVNIKKIKIYDCLSIFSCGKKINSEMNIIVFPKEKPLNIEISTQGQYEGENSVSTILKPSEDAYTDIKQLREYRDGDSNRFIHWNYSARTESLWVKEYEQETGSEFSIFLDTSYTKKPDCVQYDAFYEIISAIILGLVKDNVVVNAYWFDKKIHKIRSKEIKESKHLTELLSELYKSETEYSDNIQKTECQMTFNMNLEWYFNNQIIYRFSRTNFEDEIIRNNFIL
ncbi:MAG: DUF58 domain-containing protein [Clostridia bacterium]|nr:DUF58 domain-containing protein [Clostridia bacterium]